MRCLLDGREESYVKELVSAFEAQLAFVNKTDNSRVDAFQVLIIHTLTDDNIPNYDYASPSGKDSQPPNTYVPTVIEYGQVAFTDITAEES
jgi:hypothetical protein